MNTGRDIYCTHACNEQQYIRLRNAEKHMHGNFSSPHKHNLPPVPPTIKKNFQYIPQRLHACVYANIQFKKRQVIKRNV